MNGTNTQARIHTPNGRWICVEHKSQSFLQWHMVLLLSMFIKSSSPIRIAINARNTSATATATAKPNNNMFTIFLADTSCIPLLHLIIIIYGWDSGINTVIFFFLVFIHCIRWRCISFSFSLSQITKKKEKKSKICDDMRSILRIEQQQNMMESAFCVVVVVVVVAVGKNACVSTN